MTTSTIFRRGNWIFRFASLLFFTSIAFIAYKVPLPVLPAHNLKEKTHFFQTRQGVRKQLLTEDSEGSYSTTLTSPFTLMNSTSEGLTETLFDVKGISVEEGKETRFFSTNEAIFRYSDHKLTAQKMDFAFEKGTHIVPEKPYYIGKGKDIDIEFIDGSPQISAKTIEGSGEVPFFFGKDKNASRS